MLTVRIPSIGEVLVDLATMCYRNGKTIICGHDDDHNNCTISCSKISWQEDFFYEFGWAHIVAYTINGVTTPCNHFTSIG